MTKTPIRAKHGHIIHATEDARKTLCGRICDGWVVESEMPTCKQCAAAVKEQHVPA